MRIASILSACLLAFASLPAVAGEPAAAGTDLQAEAVARLFKPVPGKAVIYLLRDRGDVWTMGVPVYLDGRDMGATEPLSYFRWEVEPGAHMLVSATTPPAVLEISTEPGGLYYVWQDINPGHHRPSSMLHQVDQTTARATVATAVLLPSRQ
jgi:hypothetical protein